MQKGKKKDKVGALFDQARKVGAEHGTAEDLAGPSGAFRGTGRTLAGDTAQVGAIQFLAVCVHGMGPRPAQFAPLANRNSMQQIADIVSWHADPDHAAVAQVLPVLTKVSWIWPVCTATHILPADAQQQACVHQIEFTMEHLCRMPMLSAVTARALAHGHAWVGCVNKHLSHCCSAPGCRQRTGPHARTSSLSIATRCSLWTMDPRAACEWRGCTARVRAQHGHMEHACLCWAWA
jgi:hypothetical protein